MEKSRGVNHGELGESRRRHRRIREVEGFMRSGDSLFFSRDTWDLSIFALLIFFLYFLFAFLLFLLFFCLASLFLFFLFCFSSIWHSRELVLEKWESLWRIKLGRRVGTIRENTW